MIICCGEALIDMLPRKLPDGADVFLPAPGGALFNTAVALGRLQEPCAFLSGISTDIFGRRLMDRLAESSVDTSLCVRSQRPTTLAFVTLKDGQAQYSFVDENTAGRMLETGDLPPLPGSACALHFGAISLISEPCGSTFETFLHQHRSAAVISLDPNIRPDFVNDEERYRARLARVIPASDIVKVSQEDLDWLAPARSFESVAQEWIAKGTSVVVATLGKEGARAITATQDVTVSAAATHVVDTVGAGDSFNAGFLAGLRSAGQLSKQKLASIDRQAVTDALEFASRVAAVTVSRAGADPPWKSEVSRAVAG